MSLLRSKSPKFPKLVSGHSRIRTLGSLTPRPRGEPSLPEALGKGSPPPQLS